MFDFGSKKTGNESPANNIDEILNPEEQATYDGCVEVSISLEKDLSKLNIPKIIKEECNRLATSARPNAGVEIAKNSSKGHMQMTLGTTAVFFGGMAIVLGGTAALGTAGVGIAAGIAIVGAYNVLKGFQKSASAAAEVTNILSGLIKK